MKPIDYLLLGGICLLVAGITVHLIKRKRAGKGGCGCGCVGCPSAGACAARKEKQDDEAV